LSWFRRDEHGPSRARRARRSRQRLRESRLPRYAIEELETRVLLSGYGTQQTGQFVRFELPTGSADISPVARSLLFVQRQLTFNSGAAGVTSGSGSQLSSVADESEPAPRDPPLVVLVHPALSAVTKATSSGVEGDPSASFGGRQLLPMIANPGDNSSSSSVNDFPPSINDAALEASAGSVTPPAAVFLVPSSSGSGWVALQTTGPGQYDSTSSRFDGPELPVPIGVSLAEMRGTLDAAQPAMTYEIPVGPMTQSLGVTVRPATDLPAGEEPVVDEMALVDSTGKTLEQVGPPGGAGGFPSPAVFVQLHDPLDGDRVVVEIGTVEASLSTSPISTSSNLSGFGSGVVTPSASSQSASWGVSFVMSVQRQQSSASSTDAAAVVPGTETIGTLIVASTQQPVAFGSSSSSSVPAEQVGSTSLDVQATNTAGAAAPEPATELVTQSAESFNLRVPTGPLASRGGGALGPTLALVDAEPTQPVDRLERALSQEIAGLGAGDDEQTASRGNGAHDEEMSEDPGTWPGSIGTTGTVGPVVSIPGRGGFPHKVTSLGRDQRVQFAAVWATLPAAAQANGTVAGTELGAISRSELPVAQTVSYRSAPESLEFPDYVKAACGLALGLGLTSGPLFPDLIASLPGRLPKWLTILRARRGRRVVASESKKRVGRSKMPNWLRALFVSH
jgi:hypothetical protein